MTDRIEVATRRSWWPDGLYQDAGGYFRHRGPQLDLTNFRKYSAAVGRNSAPALLFDLVYIDESLDVARVPGAVADAWSSAESPERALESDTWTELFMRAGYTVDDRPAERPSEPVRVFRGCTADLIYDEVHDCDVDPRFGMSWTTDVEMARRFASGIRGRRPGNVYAAVVQPEHLLAYLGPEHRDESEFVVHPAGLSDENVVLLEELAT